MKVRECQLQSRREGTANIIEDDEGSVDAADGVVADPGRHLVRGIPGVAHDDGLVCVAVLEEITNAMLETSSEGCCKTARWIGDVGVEVARQNSCNFQGQLKSSRR